MKHWRSIVNRAYILHSDGRGVWTVECGVPPVTPRITLSHYFNNSHAFCENDCWDLCIDNTLYLSHQKTRICTKCLSGPHRGKTTVSVLLEKCHWRGHPTPDLLLLIQQKLRIVQSRHGSLSLKSCEKYHYAPWEWPMALQPWSIPTTALRPNSTWLVTSRLDQWRRQEFRLGGPHPPLSPLLSLSFFPSPPSLSSLRSRPLQFQLWGLGSAVSSPVGCGAEPQPKSNLVHFRLKIWHLMATIFNNFPENEVTKFTVVFHTTGF